MIGPSTGIMRRQGSSVPLPIMLPSELGGALAYHFKGDAGVTMASLTRIPGTPSGVNGNPTIPSNASLQVTNQSWTYAGWFQVDSLAATMTLLSKNATGANEWDANISATTGILGLITIFAAAPNFHIVATANAVTAGVPFFAAWGCDGTNQWVRLNNGTRATVAHNTTTHALSATAAALKFGVNDATTEPMTGGAGNVGFWKGRSLSDAELNSLYNSGAGVDYSALAGLGLTTNLVSYWRMKEKEGTRFDSHGTNHLASVTRCQTINATGIVSVAAGDQDSVSLWADQSGNNRHLQAVVATNVQDYRPVYIASGLNGKPTLRFLGKEQTLKRAFALAQPVHIFALVKPRNWGAGMFLWDGNTENAMGLKGVTSAPTFGLNAGLVGPSSALPIGRWSIVEACYNGASSFIRVNGGSKITVDAGATTTGGLWLGLDGGNDLASDYAKHPDVEFAEIFAATAPQNDADSVKLRRYLTNKYAGSYEGASWPAWNPDKLFVMDGSSLNIGFACGAFRSPATTALSILGSGWDHMVVGYGGKTLATCRGEFATRASWAYNSSRSKNVWCTLMLGDPLLDSSGNTAQQAYDAYKLHLTELRAVGWKVVASTPPPILSAIGGAGYEARRQAFATIVRNNPADYDALADVAANANVGAASGGEPPTADSLYRDTDRTHFSWLGAAELGQLFATAIASV